METQTSDEEDLNYIYNKCLVDIKFCNDFMKTFRTYNEYFRFLNTILKDNRLDVLIRDYLTEMSIHVYKEFNVFKKEENMRLLKERPDLFDKSGLDDSKNDEDNDKKMSDKRLDEDFLKNETLQKKFEIMLQNVDKHKKQTFGDRENKAGDILRSQIAAIDIDALAKELDSTLVYTRHEATGDSNGQRGGINAMHRTVKIIEKDNSVIEFDNQMYQSIEKQVSMEKIAEALGIVKPQNIKGLDINNADKRVNNKSNETINLDNYNF